MGLTRDLSRVQVIFVVSVFYLLPLGVGVVSHEKGIEISDDQFSSLISVYAIFSALLFGAQISAFSIFRGLTDFQAARFDPNEVDAALKASVETNVAERISDLKLAFGDINANISYLITTSVVLLCILLVFSISESANVFFSSVVISLTVHLVLILIMVVKQCHLIFSAAYSE
ncbi:hypothetical protein [Salipiger bermudensis]|uniref:hypothetical protein n=1 Tax=Salipiger bermudensis TaxID=344736 RepID=UPI00300947FE